MAFNSVLSIGYWNADTNQPPIVSGRGITGTTYIVSVAGTTNIDGVTNWAVGDWITYGLDRWYKIGSQYNNAALDALGALTPAADKVPYFTGPNSAALADFTAKGREIVGAANSAAARSAIGITSNPFALFETVTEAAAATIPADIDSLTVNGYAAPGDGGWANYKRVGSLPANGGFASNAGTSFWELVPHDNRVSTISFGLDTANSGAVNATALANIQAYSVRKQAEACAPPGIFTVGGFGVRMESGFQLTGAGSNLASGTVFLFTANGYPLFGGKDAATTRHYNIKLSSFAVDNEDKTRTGSVGIDFRNISTSFVEDIVTTRCHLGFQYYGDSLVLGSLYNHTSHTNATDCTRGYEVGGVANRNTFLEIRTNGTVDALVLGDCNNNNFFAPCFEVTSGPYVVTLNAACYGNGFYGMRIENSPTSGTGMKVSSTSDYNFLIGEFFTGLTTEVEDNSGKLLRFGPSATSFRGVNITRMFRHTHPNYALPSLAAGADTGIVTFTVTGVATGDEVRLEHPYAWSGYTVTILAVINAGTDTVQVIFQNYGSSTLSIPTYADLVFTVTRYE